MRGELREEEFAKETLERYSGSSVSEFQSNLLLTNFPKYVDYFGETRKVRVLEGSMFKVAHDPKEKISILDFKIGSPAAALVVDLCSFLPIKSSVLLGMWGGQLPCPRRQHSGRGDLGLLFSGGGAGSCQLFDAKGGNRNSGTGSVSLSHWDHFYDKYAVLGV